jgi:hypothetical protein
MIRARASERERSMPRPNRTKRARKKTDATPQVAPKTRPLVDMETPRALRFAIPILLLATAIVYAPAVSGGWVYDDLPHIVNNTALQTATTLKGIMLCGWSETRPLFNLVNRAQIELTTLTPAPFHIANIAFHLTCGVLVFFFLKTLGEARKDPPKRTMRMATVACAIFLLHPLETESVANVNGRSGVLMTLFYVASMFLYTKDIVHRRAHPSEKRSPYFWGSLAAGMVAQGFKESAITLVFMIWGIDFLTRDRSEWKKDVIASARTVAPFLATTLAVPFLLETVKNPHALNIGMHALDPWLHFVTQWKILGMFVAKFFMPIDQNFDYDIPLSTTNDPMPLVGLAALVAMTVIVVRARKEHPLGIPAWIFFLVAISPTNSIVPNIDFVAERHMYLPLLGLAVIVADRVSILAWPRFVWAASAIAIYFAAFTFARDRTWSNDELILRDTIAKSPGKDRPYMALAYKFVQAKRYPDAVGVYLDCIAHTKVTPLRVQLFTNLGEVYRVMGDRKDAIDAYDRAIAMEPYIYPKSAVDQARAARDALVNPLGATPLRR